MADRRYLRDIFEELLGNSEDDMTFLTVLRQALFAATVIIGHLGHLDHLRRDHVPRVPGFAENVVPAMNSRDFVQHFRMSRGAFEQVLQLIGPIITDNVVPGGKEAVNVDKQLLLFVWYMANQDSMREVSVLFDLSLDTVHAVIYRLLDVFQNHLSHVSIIRSLFRDISGTDYYTIEKRFLLCFFT